MKELNELRTNPPEGIRVVTNEDNMLDVTGIIEGPGGWQFTSGIDAWLTISVSFPCLRGLQRVRRMPAATSRSDLASRASSLPRHPNVGPLRISRSELMRLNLHLGWFATKIFHPNVSSAGEICVNTLKKDWQSSYGIGHILVTVKCLLIYPNPESALDEEAGKLLLENYDSYCSRAKLITSVHATPAVREWLLPRFYQGGVLTLTALLHPT